jgi:ethanolamine utilization protein EutM
MQNAIGLIETKGLLASIEATDAMAKAASVEIMKRIDIGGALVTTVVTGDVGSVRAAVEAGSAAATQVGDLVSSHVIPRPSDAVVAALTATTAFKK